MHPSNQMQSFEGILKSVPWVVLLALGGCGGNEPISSQTSKFEVASDGDEASSSANNKESSNRDDKSTAPESQESPQEEANEKIASTNKIGGEATSSQAPADTEAAPRNESGVYKPPQGAAAKQIEFIKRISKLPPRGNSAQSQRIDFEDKMNAVVLSCDLILEDPKGTSEEKQFAIQNKFFVLSEMSAKLQNDSYAEKAMTFAAELQGKEKGSVERELGVAIGVGLLPQQFAMVQSPTDEDVKKLVDGYLSYLAEGPLPPMYQPGLQVAKMLHDLKKRDKAIAVLEAMLAAYNEAKDLPDREKAVSELDGMRRIYQVNLANKVRAVIEDEKKFAELDGSFEELLKEDGSKTQWLEFVYGVGATLEKAGKTEPATKVYERLAKLNENAVDAAIGKQIGYLLENATKRKNLVGTTLDFSGETSDKKTFQLNTLKEKPILVLFWAAMDGGASFDEFANLEQTLLNTKSAFSVVLVNVDDDPAIFSKFSELQKITWADACVRCADADKKGFESDLEKQIGIDTVPFSILLDPSGKVVATYAQGVRLESLINSLLAGQEEKKQDQKEQSGDAEKNSPPESAPSEKEKAESEKVEKPATDPPKDP